MPLQKNNRTGKKREFAPIRTLGCPVYSLGTSCQMRGQASILPEFYHPIAQKLRVTDRVDSGLFF